MGYRQMETSEIYDLYRRWHEGSSISGICKDTGTDRKTVRKYVNRILKAGFTRQVPLEPKESFFATLGDVLPKLRRVQGVRGLLDPYKEELHQLINDPTEPVKPKTAYLIICHKHDLTVSYETFKIFARENRLTRRAQKPILRIETAPGQEIQLDYGMVGRIHDTTEDRNRDVCAFCGILACSRLPFIQFGYRQKAPDFANSVIDMGEFYGGFTRTLRMDNLKAAVIKPDLWDPQLNRSLQEVAEHYGFFIDPCRVRNAKEKGKIERQVPPARELFRRLKHIHPSATLSELNAHALKWSLEEYGLKVHGTTGQRPWEVYEQQEKPALKPLPADRYEVGDWKKAVVHPDRFIALNRKYYAVPDGYKESTVWVRKYGEILRLYDITPGTRFLREYLITSKLRSYLPQDFPEGRAEMMEGVYPRFLLSKARFHGEAALRYIDFILQPHAYLNIRRAQGVLAVMAAYSTMPSLSTVCQRALAENLRNPKVFKILCEDERQQLQLQFPMQQSAVGQAMTRPVSYFFTPLQGGVHGNPTTTGTASETAAYAGNAVHTGTAAR
jgi:transposase